jgi:hypothetical protein
MQLKEDLSTLKERLELIESQLEGEMQALDIREAKWSKLDMAVDKILDKTDQVIKFNVSGQHFATKRSTLNSVPDTLFHKVVNGNGLNLKEAVFFDRSPCVFQAILDFLRTKTINYRAFNKYELIELYQEADYYEVEEIANYLRERTKDIECIKCEISGNYLYKGKTAGTNRFQDLKDKTLKKGICTGSPGFIILDLNSDWEFEEMEIAGYIGDPELWYSGNGSGAAIETSMDRVSWTKVGSIPSNYANAITKVKVKKTQAKYVRFSHTSYLGIGYVNITKIEEI